MSFTKPTFKPPMATDKPFLTQREQIQLGQAINLAHTEQTVPPNFERFQERVLVLWDWIRQIEVTATEHKYKKQ